MYSEKLVERINAVLESGLTAYRIAKEVGYASANPVHKLMTGESDIEGMKFTTAIEFEKLYKKIEEETKMGKVEFEGKTYTLTQEAYIDGPADETPIYKASAVDQEGIEYEVIWDVVDNFEEIEDEQEMVEDWDKPASVEAI